MLFRNKNLASVRALNRNAETIIKLCDLKERNSWEEWEDSYGNKLKIYRDGSFKILTVKNQDFSTTTDIYFKLSPEKLVQKANKVFLLKGNFDVKLFIGKDYRLRTALFDNEWIGNFPPLLVRKNVLTNIVKQKEEKIKERLIILNKKIITKELCYERR